MDGIVFILVLVIGAIIVLPIVAIVIANSTARQLRAEIPELLERIRSLESELRRLAGERVPAIPTRGAEPSSVSHAAPPAIAPVHVEPPLPSESQEPDLGAAPTFADFYPHQEPPPLEIQAAASAPAFRTLHEAGSQDSQSLESRIGSQWFNRIGILAVLIGVAWFLKLAFDNHWIGPLGRVLIGLIAGVALIVWSERFQKRNFAVFSYSLKAIGSGTLYLSLWAAFQLYALIPPGLAFAAMIAVTSFNGFMAWMQDAELLALYAIAGGLSSPLLVSTGGNHEITLFSYLLILDLAVFVLAILRPWSRLLFAAYAGTVIFIFGWWTTFYTYGQVARTAFFLICFFVPFSLAPRLVKIATLPGSQFEIWDGLVSFILPVANAALGFLAFYLLFDSAVHPWWGPWLAVIFAAYYLLLLWLPNANMLSTGVAGLSGLHLTAGIVFLTIAIPLKTHGRWMTIGWLVEGAALVWVSRRARSLLLRAFGLICVLLGLGALLVADPAAIIRPIFNERFATYCIAIAVCAYICWLARNSKDEIEPAPPVHWPNVAVASALAVSVLILVAFSWEIHSYWWTMRWHVDNTYDLYRDYWMYAQLSYSAFFMIYGSMLLTLGFLKRTAFLRWQALILIAVTIGKVFLVDMSSLNRELRVLSFIGLGVLLLCVSYVYQRDWLNLRGRKKETA